MQADPKPEARTRGPVLDARLAAVAALVPSGSRVADVGCDHGKLSVALARSGRVKKVIAIDVRPAPLARAQALADQTGCGPLVECRLADGLSCIQPGEADTVVLAGMSGVTICEILSAAPWVRSSGVLLLAVPASKAEVLRRWLAENGFGCEAEQAVLAAGRVYPVLAARWDGVRRPSDERSCRLGTLASAPGAAAQAYREKVLRQLQRQLAGELAGARYGDAERQALARLKDEVEQLCGR